MTDVHDFASWTHWGRLSAPPDSLAVVGEDVGIQDGRGKEERGKREGNVDKGKGS